ncbi:MAG: hypothetical protein J0H68_08910 [Sphingobacteriia bacterium]|nr:hypothetical protein [Sphingobacteriia bacterium]
MIKSTDYQKKKINTGYYSVFEFLASTISWFFKLEKRIEPENANYGTIDFISHYANHSKGLENSTQRTSLIKALYNRRRYNEEFYPQDDKEMIKGSFQPLKDLKRGLQNFLNGERFRFKSSKYVKYEVMKPLYGLGNIIRGIGELLLILPTYVLNEKQFFTSDKNEKWVRVGIEYKPLNINILKAWAIEGGLSIVKGAMQIVSTPLSYFTVLPFRALYTSFKGYKPIEQNKDIQALIKKGRNLLKDPHKNLLSSNVELEFQSSPFDRKAKFIRTEIERKVKKYAARGQLKEVKDWNYMNSSTEQGKLKSVLDNLTPQQR